MTNRDKISISGKRSVSKGFMFHGSKPDLKKKKETETKEFGEETRNGTTVFP